MTVMKESHIEIERKFLVDGDFRSSSVDALHIVQGYLSTSSGVSGRRKYLWMKRVSCCCCVAPK